MEKTKELCKEVFVPDPPKHYTSCNPRRRRLTAISDIMLKKLFEWRLDYAMVIDDKEHNIIPDYQDMAINYTRIEEEQDLLNFYNLKPIVLKQSRKLFYILTNNQVGLENFSQKDCHNCFHLGHVAAVCPFLKNNKRHFIYYGDPAKLVYAQRRYAGYMRKLQLEEESLKYHEKKREMIKAAKLYFLEHFDPTL